MWSISTYADSEIGNNVVTSPKFEVSFNQEIGQYFELQYSLME